MGQNPYRGIIFDFGGVFTTTRSRDGIFRRCEAELGLSTGTVSRLLYGTEIWRAVSCGKASAEDYWDYVTSELGGRVPAELEPFKHNPFSPEELDKRMVLLARRLHKRYKTALCSNATLYLDTLLPEHGLLPLFDVVVNSARVGLRKPDPQIYRLTADRMGLLPEECVFVDDKERNTAVAEMLGMKAIVFRSAAQLVRQLDASGITSRAQM